MEWLAEVRPEDVDAMLRGLDDAALLALVEAVGTIPDAERWRLTAAQRMARRAQNMLSGRRLKAEAQSAAAQGQAAVQLEQKIRARAEQRRAVQQAELEPLLERKRKELQYR